MWGRHLFTVLALGRGSEIVRNSRRYLLSGQIRQRGSTRGGAVCTISPLVPAFVLPRFED